MFDLIDPEPRGFSGRPLIALLFAVVLGIVLGKVVSRFRLNDFTAFTISVTVTGVVGFAWERLETSRGGNA